nr:ribonuclease H-like domain-containing protein [Tanacetum cinerariifolium]
MFLSPRKYATEILEQAGMISCNSSRTLVNTESKLGDDGDLVSDPTLYRSLAGSLQYLTFTHPDISYAVQHVCLYMHDPREPHFSSLKRILRYVRDADWAGFPTTQRSTSGYYVFLGDNLLFWSSMRQPMLSLSSAEADYCGVAKTCWFRNLLIQYQRTKHIEIDIVFVRDLVIVGQLYDWLLKRGTQSNGHDWMNKAVMIGWL